MNDPNFGTWNVAESPFTAEYSIEVIEQIRAAVQEGFQRLSRGGIEAGGVLYGTHSGRTIRVLAQRPIPCEHTRGPAFLLSDQDKAGLTALLDRRDKSLGDLTVVGWYVSHTKSEICLNESDLEIYNGYFAAPWHVTLVLRPGRYGGTRAGFFVREPDGSVQVERSYLDFNVPDRTPNALERIVAEPRQQRPGPADRTPQSRTHLLRASRQVDSARAVPAQPPAPAPPRPAESKLEPPRFQAPRMQEVPRFATEPPRNLKWVWWLMWVVSLAATGYGAHWFAGASALPEPLDLRVAERDGQLQIEWNRSARIVAMASRALVNITDGTASKEIPLNLDDLRKGSMPYVRRAAEVQVKLSVFSPEGKSTQESTRFLGREAPAKDSEDLAALRRQRDQLAEEVNRLQRTKGSQTERIQQLERAVRILETRLNIRGDKQ